MQKVNATKKRKVNWHGKNYYLIGADKNGLTHWLEEPSWSCDWYWETDLVVSFNRNTPANSTDLDGWSHFHYLIHGQGKGLWERFNECFVETPLTKKEIWTLMELMETAHTLCLYSETLCRGGSHITSNPCKDVIKSDEERNRINKEVLPTIFKQIEDLLVTPNTRVAYLEKAIPKANKMFASGKSFKEINDELNLFERLPSNRGSITKESRASIYDYTTYEGVPFFVKTFAHNKDEVYLVAQKGDYETKVSVYSYEVKKLGEEREDGNV